LKEKKKKNRWQFKILILFIISLVGIGFWSSLKEKNELKNLQTELNLVKDNLEETINFQSNEHELDHNWCYYPKIYLQKW
jgi:lipopolysaccharide export system protein LptC